MKNILIAIFTILFASFTVPEKQNVKDLITAKWYVESVQEQGEHPEKAENKNDEWICFYKDGKVEESSFGKLNTGTWYYMKDEKAIKVIADETLFYNIIEVSESSLIVEVGDEIDSQDHTVITYTK